jgi:twitching motility two-component system response regulator PilH
MTTPSLHLLVIDDSAEFLSFMEALLTSEDFRVDTAQSGEAALQRLAVALPDLVLCDVRMPDMEPFGILHLLRRDPRTRDIPVLLCTGAVQEVDAAASWLREHGVEVLLKPFDVEDLLARLQKLSSRTRE